MSVEWIDHKGKRILYIKYQGLTPEQMIEQVRSAAKTIVASKSKEVLSLSDVSECFIDKQFLEVAKEQGAISLSFTKKAAVVGVTGVKKILLNSVNLVAKKPRKAFDNVKDAKDWLVAE